MKRLLRGRAFGNPLNEGGELKGQLVLSIAASRN